MKSGRFQGLTTRIWPNGGTYSDMRHQVGHTPFPFLPLFIRARTILEVVWQAGRVDKLEGVHRQATIERLYPAEKSDIRVVTLHGLTVRIYYVDDKPAAYVLMFQYLQGPMCIFNLRTIGTINFSLCPFSLCVLSAQRLKSHAIKLSEAAQTLGGERTLVQQ